MIRGNLLLASLTAVVVTGCSFFSRPDNHIYSLQTTRSEGTVVALSGPPFGIDGIELPPELDRREIVVRRADHQLEIRGTQQWAATLQDLVLHTLAFDLANRLPEGMVVLPGAAKPDTPMRSIDVAFDDLAAGADNTFVLDARWIVRVPGATEVTHHERITVPLTSADSAAIVAATNGALSTLADRMAAGLAR